MKGKGAWRELAGYLAAAAMAVAGCGAILVGRMPFLDDTLRFNLPERAFVWAQWRAGHLPLWWPYVMCGTPVAGEGQAGIFFPLNLLGAAFANPVTAYCVVFVLTYVVAAMGMYALGRVLGLSRTAAVAAAAVFGLGGPMVSHHPHMMMVETVALWPWTFAAGLRAIERPRQWGWIATAAMLVALQWLAFSPQLIVIGAGVFLWLAAWDGRRRGSAWKAVGLGVGFYALGTLAAALQFLPAAQYWGVSGVNAIPSSWSLDFPPWPVRFVWLGPVLSALFGGWKHRIWGFHWSETCLFAGVVATGLAIGAALCAKVRRERWFWPWASLGVAALAYGSNHIGTAVYELLGHVPLLKGMRCHTRVAFVVVMAIAVLAGLAIDAAGDGKVRRRLMWAVGSVTGVALAAMLVLPGLASLAHADRIVRMAMDLWPSTESSIRLWAQRAEFWREVWAPWSVAFVAAAAAGIAGAALLARGRRKLVAAVIVAEMVVFFAANVWTREARMPTPVPAAGRLAETRSVKMQTDEWTLLGVPLFNGVVAEALRPAAPDELRDAATNSGNSGEMAIWGCSPWGRWRERAWAPDEVLPARGKAEALAEYVKEVAAGHPAVVPVEGADETSCGPAVVEVSDPAADEVDLSVDADGPTAIVLCDTWYPGWKAWVDGKPAKIYRAGGYFRCVMVQGGKHETIRMRYEPKSMLIGAVVSLVVWLLLLAVAVVAKEPEGGR